MYTLRSWNKFLLNSDFIQPLIPNLYMQRLLVSLKTKGNTKMYRSLLHRLEPLCSSCLSWKVNVKLQYSAFLKLGKAVGVSIKNHRNGKGYVNKTTDLYVWHTSLQTNTASLPGVWVYYCMFKLNVWWLRWLSQHGFPSFHVQGNADLHPWFLVTNEMRKLLNWRMHHQSGKSWNDSKSAF